MVMVLVTRLVRECGIEGDAFIDISVTVPHTVTSDTVHGTAVRLAGGLVGERVPAVEHRHPVHEVSDGACSGGLVTGGG